ncbi:MAG: RagB/SusD family nutrient uptake outer membrane protein [Bacteroidota bacterium]
MKKYLYMMLLVVFSAACSAEFLNLQPNEALPTENAIQSIDDLTSAIIGVYSGLQSSDHYGRYFVLVPDVMSDDVKQNASANRAKEYAEFEAFSEHFITQNMWARLYSTINRANVVINNTLEVTDAAQDEKSQIEGEAYAIRALCHFDLVRIYGQHYGFTGDNSHLGVPIITEFDEDGEPSRNTVAQVYQQVISDLTTAIDKMGDDFSSTRMSKVAAQALLARVNLYMGEYAAAANLADAVISSGEVGLGTSGDYLDSWANGTSPDPIFEISYSANDNNGSDALGRMYIIDGYGDYLPSADLLNLIDTADLRSNLFKFDGNLGGIFGDLRVDKFPSVIGTDNFPVIRLSEIYMIRAEARYRTGNETGAQADVDAIRQRAWPTAAAVTATGTALLDEIEKEKRVELMFEGHRLWDLMRWQRGVTRTDCTAPTSACDVAYPNDRFILPMPQNEIDANPNIAQNPGY